MKIGIKLSNSKKFAVIDSIDLGKVDGISWCIKKPGYVSAWVSGQTIYLHRVILGASKGQTVDHKDGNPLNNTRTNLRFCTQGENRCNSKPHGTSKYLGVSFVKQKGRLKWLAQIRKGDIFKHKKFFTEEEAAVWRDSWAIKLHGEFALLNFKAV